MSPRVDRAVGWGGMAWLSGAGRPPGGSYRAHLLGNNQGTVMQDVFSRTLPVATPKSQS